MNTYDVEHIFILGDTHNLYILPLLEKFEVKNAIIIHVGDWGVGYRNPLYESAIFGELDEYLQKNNCKIFAIRGNHDDPDYWDSEHTYTVEKYFPNIEFVPDYTYKTINGKVFLFAGGATSIDRQLGTEGINYWENEIFKLPKNLKKLPTCDVLITHSAPYEAYPCDGFAGIAHWFEKDKKLKRNLRTERKNLSKLYNQVNPSIQVYGHFHKTVSERINGTWFRCLDKWELIELTNYLK